MELVITKIPLTSYVTDKIDNTELLVNMQQQILDRLAKEIADNIDAIILNSIYVGPTIKINNNGQFVLRGHSNVEFTKMVNWLDETCTGRWSYVSTKAYGTIITLEEKDRTLFILKYMQ